MSNQSDPEVRKMPYFRDCLQEVPDGIETQVQGKLPHWLKGTLLRNGPGQVTVGDSEYKHLMDGLAIIQAYTIDGTSNSVIYRNRFLKSSTYKTNMASNRIVVSEIGTRAYSDPCKSLFQKFVSFFTVSQSDNAIISFLTMGDEVYAVTETPTTHRIDPETLETMDSLSMANYVAVHTQTAHPHVDEKEGYIYNLGSKYGPNPETCVIRMPLKKGFEDSLKQAEIMASIPVKNPFKPTYYHSFGMTENYVIFIEQPVTINFLTMPFNYLVGNTLSVNMGWDPNVKTHFILVNRKTGKIAKTDFFSDTFCYLHTINSYEEDGKIIMDICCYEDGSMLQKMYRDQFEKTYMDKGTQILFHSEARRYVLPLDMDIESSTRMVYCDYEKLTHRGFHTAEFARINDSYDCKKYRYFYALSRRAQDSLTQLIKVDVETKEVVFWEQDDYFPSEPVFIANPNGVDEDDGVVVAAVIHEQIETIGFLLILDAKTFKEVSRATFESPSAICADFHGIYVNSKNSYKK